MQHLPAQSGSIGQISKISHRQQKKKKKTSFVRNHSSWLLSPWSDVGLSHQGDGNKHRRWSVGMIDTCAGPWALIGSRFLLLLSFCHLVVSLMVSSHGLLLRNNRFHLPVKPPGRLWLGKKKRKKKMVRAWKKLRAGGISPANINTSPPSTPRQA